MRTVHVTRLGFALLLAALVALAACGPDEPQVPDTDEEVEAPTEPAPPADESPEDAEADMHITGTFGGDPDLEGGCAWVDGDDGERYEVLWPDGYEVEFNPLELLGPDGEVVATAGDSVSVAGEVAEDMASFCMVGTLFTAVEVHAE